MTAPEAFALGLQHHQAGRLKEAEALYRQVLAVQPGHAEAPHRLGILAQHAGRSDLAEKWFHHAALLAPNNSMVHFHLGEACRSLGRFDEAFASYRKAIQLKPGDAKAYCGLGALLRGRGQFEEAIATYRRALQVEPNFAVAHNNLANVLMDQGYFDQAAIAYRRALELKPDAPEAWNNLGIVLTEQGQFEAAAAAHRRALELRPHYPEAQSNLALALAGQGLFDEAVMAYRHALQLKPDYAEAHNNLATLLKDQGQLDEAIAGYRRALALQPDYAYVQSNIIYALQFHPSQDRTIIAEEQRRWNCRFAQPWQHRVRPHFNNHDPERRLRIGYVSPEFRDHVTGRYLVPLFGHHDRRNFEILCYSGVRKADWRTDEFRRGADQWRDAIGVTDEVLTETIRQDGVDILVDLTQHLADNRLLVFARQPAPVQVSFAGYPESTGLEAIGYRISDRYLETETGNPSSPAKDQVCLIDSFWCYDPCGLEMESNSLPASENGWVTFGCLNNFCKINEGVLRLWARVLGQVSASRLVILSPTGSHRRQTLNILGRQGIAAHRVEFVDPRPRRAYLELYHRLDIVLDPFPSNGHTTSLDALWMGVPVVSLAGEQAVARAGYSQLSNLGLPELAAFSPDDYLALATQLAGDLPRLAHLRATLRSRMQASPLMDAVRFTRQIESAYRTMWRNWCAQNPNLAQ